MAQLAIGLLGTFHLARPGAVGVDIESDKGRALLAYLAVEAAYAHRRKTLATMLWPEADQQRANQNLRRALYNLRQAVEEPADASPLLLISPQDVQFNSAATCWLDVSAFQALLDATQNHPHRRLDSCKICIERLAEAVALYRGDFLAGLALNDCDTLEGWRLLKQEELRGRLMEALLTVAAYHERLREYEQAARYLRRLIELEPWREEGHRRLMSVLALDGQRGAALQQYELCRRVLAEEMGLAPTDETVELYRRIAAGELRPVLSGDESPYKGLAEFGEEDASIYFGRESLVERLLDTLQRNALVVVVGASGAGKSSFLRAGVLPRLRPGAPGDQGERWIIATLRPGSRPFAALAEALLPLLAPRQDTTESLAQDLASGASTLHDLTAQALAWAQQREGANAPRRLLLVTDQFEELYTLCPDAQTRRAFLDLLLEPERASGTTADQFPVPGARLTKPVLGILISLRADFAGQSLSYRPLADAIQQGGLIVGPMTRDELRRAIVEPARLRGLLFEPGLVERLLDDVGGEPGNLPLLEFALTLLWARRHDERLTHDAYEEIGGVAGALTSYTEQVFARLDSAEQEAARRVFVQLVQPGEGTADTRRLAVRADIGEDHWRIVQQLADARLLVTGADALGHEGAELVHEALITNWARLKNWLAENRVFRVWQQRLRGGDLAQWRSSNGDPGWLLRGVALAEAVDWLYSHRDELSPHFVNYIERSIAQRDSEQAADEQRRQRELQQVRALADSESRRADAEAEARQEQGLLSMLALSAAQQAQREQARATRSAAVAQSFNLTTNARLALNERNTDLALALAREANRIDDPPPPARLMLAQAAYAPGTRYVLNGHSGPVLGLALSPEGATAVSASADGTLIVWDVATGAELRRLSGHSDAVFAVAYSPVGDNVLSASGDGSLILWDISTGVPLRLFSGHSGAVRSVAFSPDGRTALSASADGTLIVWDVATGAVLRRLRGHEGAVNCVAISPDGTRAVSGANDRSVIVWDLAAGAVAHRFQGQQTTMEGTAGVLGHWNFITSIAFFPDGRQAVSVGEDECVVLWNLIDYKLMSQFRTGSQVFSLALLPDGLVLVGTLDNRILEFELAHEFEVRRNPRTELQLLGHSGRVHALALAADGRTLVSAAADGTVRVWDMRNGAEVRPLNVDPSAAAAVAISPDGRTGLTGRWDGLILLWDYATGAILRQLTGHGEMIFPGAFFTPDSRYVVSGSGDLYGKSVDHTVRLWDVASGQEIRRFEEHTDKIWSLSLSADGRYSASGSADGTVWLWEIATDAARLVWDVSPQLPRSLAFSPDSRQLLIGPGKGVSSKPDFSLLLRDLATNTEVLRFVGHAETVSAVTFSPDGKLIASASHDKRVIIWNASTAATIHRLIGQAASLNSLAFSPDGLFLVGGDQTGTLYLWAVGSGDLLRVYQGHKRPVTKVGFTPGGQTIFSGADDDTVREWRLDATQEALQNWLAVNRYVPELTPQERILYGIG